MISNFYTGARVINQMFFKSQDTVLKYNSSKNNENSFYMHIQCATEYKCNFTMILPSHVLCNNVSFSAAFLSAWMLNCSPSDPWLIEGLLSSILRAFLQLFCRVSEQVSTNQRQLGLIGDNCRFSDFGHKVLKKEKARNVMSVFFHTDLRIS